MKRNDCDDFPDTVIIGSSALYPLAKGAIQMLILFIIILFKLTSKPFFLIHSKITMAGDVVPYYTVTALVHTLK